jgi:hypothetical protein
VKNVLHIVDAAAPQDCLKQLSLLAGPSDRIVSVGAAPARNDLVRPVEPVHAPLGSARLCGRRVAALAGDADVIHAWSAVGLKAARAAAMMTGLPVICTLPHLPARAELEGILDVACAGPLSLTVPTEASRAELIRRGAPAVAAHVLNPPAAPLAGQEGTREAVRKELGLIKSDFLLVAPGEMTRDAGQTCAAWAHAMVRHIRSGVKLLLPGSGEAFGSVRFFSARTGFAEDVLVTEGRLSLAESLAAADAAVFFHKRDCGVSALAAAMAASLPIACSNTPDAAECTAGGKAALLVKPAEPRAAAQAVLRLIESAALARRIARKAKAVAAKSFDPAACRRRLSEIHAATAAACAA